MEQDKELKIKKIQENLYLLDENGESTGFVIIGDEKACLIDTMNGYFDYSQVVRDLTDREVIVINTHGHPDHVGGNKYFKEAYIHPADRALAAEFGAHGPFIDIVQGDVIDLGNLTLKVYEIPGHTLGSIMLLCPEERILFAGDSVNHHLWLQLDGCLPVSEYVDALERLLFLEKEADYLLHGHTRDMEDISLLSAIYQGARDIAAGHTENDTPYKWFGGEGLYHPFEVEAGKSFIQEDHGICYVEGRV